MDVSVQEVRNIGLEERLDKVILLMESQNKAWDKCLQLLLGINEVLTAKMREQQLLLEQHPPMWQQSNQDEAAPSFNVFSDAIPYGTELESERDGATQSFPPSAAAPSSQNHQEETEQAQHGFREPPPQVPVTSKAEMLEQVEKKPEV